MTDRDKRFREDEADIPVPDRERLTDKSPSKDELEESGFHELRPEEINADEIVEVEDEDLEGREEVSDETVDADLLLGGLALDEDEDFQTAGGAGETGGESGESGGRSALHGTMGTGNIGTPEAHSTPVGPVGPEDTTEPAKSVKPKRGRSDRSRKK